MNFKFIGEAVFDRDFRLPNTTRSINASGNRSFWRLTLMAPNGHFLGLSTWISILFKFGVKQEDPPDATADAEGLGNVGDFRIGGDLRMC